MNPHIGRLFKMSQAPSRLIIGLMSGTSLDGLDIALCRVSGSGTRTNLELLHFVTTPYDAIFRDRIREVFAQRMIDQQLLCGLNAYIGKVHARLILEALENWGIPAADVDLIASHGQTVYHAPQRLTEDESLPNSTLQIGDGDHVAFDTGIITVADFRQKHLAAGGEGAPLAAYGDFLLYSSADEHRILLNIGGISNFTFLPKVGSGLAPFATDVGPGNTMMNQYMQTHLGEEMDRNGALAASGQVNGKLLSLLNEEEFLKQQFPKTTGPELFNLTYLNKKLEALGNPDLSPQDIMATLNAFSASSMVASIERVSEGLDNVAIYTSGGGLYNSTLMASVRKQLPQMRFGNIHELNMNPDAKEACLFAVLANETVAGQAQHVEGIKDSPAVTMGKICLPH